jgi:3-oxoacyl-[acyl-carrier-protein] synthase I
VASRWVDGRGAVLAGAGMVCSLGLDARTALAAARAQVSRAKVQQHFRMRSEVEGVEEPVVGHSVDLLTAGFERNARVQRLAQAALEQVLAATSTHPAWQLRLGLFAALPQGPAAGRAAEDADDDDPPPPSRADKARWCLQSALLAARWPHKPGTVQVSPESGPVAGLAAMAAAADAIAQGRLDAAVVLAADTLLDEDTLKQLHAAGRLKCDGAPAGLQPGEAAVALLLASGPAADTRHTRCVGLGFDEETAEVAGGEALSRVMAAVGAHRNTGRAWVLSDHNGEHARAHDWGSAWARLRGLDAAYADADVWYPALSFGCIGAVAGLAAAAMAQRAHERGYAPSSASIVSCADDGAARAALLLQHA